MYKYTLTNKVQHHAVHLDTQKGSGTLPGNVWSNPYIQWLEDHGDIDDKGNLYVTMEEHFIKRGHVNFITMTTDNMYKCMSLHCTLYFLE